MPRVKRTRRELVDRALALASVVGLESISLGVLATDVDLSKSGLYAHFRSKEALQLAVLTEAIDRFTAVVVAPALAAPRGEPRVTVLFERFLAWIRTGGTTTGGITEGEIGAVVTPTPPGTGCIFMALSQEYDDRAGAIRDALVHSQRDWRETIARVVRGAMDEGHFRADLDAEQFAFELVGMAMTFQQSQKLLADERAGERVQVAFESLLARSRGRRSVSG